MNKIFQADFLNRQGLNLHCVFNIDDLPKKLKKALATSSDITKYTQLILIGHGGDRLWKKIKQSKFQSKNPIDDFTIKTVTDFLDQHPENGLYKFLYPGARIAPLVSLGELAGWHNPSLFRIGINEKWGTWFAYRAVVLTQSNYKPTAFIQGKSPCISCDTKPCISSCPAQAVSENKFDFNACYDYRKTPNSKCKDRCLARLSCPIASEHQYPKEQVKYHYGLSLKTLQNMS